MLILEINGLDDKVHPRLLILLIKKRLHIFCVYFPRGEDQFVI